MRAVFDITDDQSDGSPFGMPAESCVFEDCVFEDDDDIVIALSDCEIRMAFPQFVVFTDALNAYRFRRPCAAISMGGNTDTVEELREADLHLDEEHEVLRRLVDELVAGAVGSPSLYLGSEPTTKVDVPEAVSKVVLDRVRTWRHTNKWTAMAAQLRGAKDRIAELEETFKDYIDEDGMLHAYPVVSQSRVIPSVCRIVKNR
jgi:hypothetical protein